MEVLPVQWHALGLGLFASIIAPFGGFFASGFKRAFKIKVNNPTFLKRLFHATFANILICILWSFAVGFWG